MIFLIYFIILLKYHITIFLIYVGGSKKYAFMGHWDEFQHATTTIKDCWTLENMDMNGGTHSDIGPIPILFIPTSSKDIIQVKHVNVLQEFLLPFIEELEHLHVEGIDVPSYAYPSSLI